MNKKILIVFILLVSYINLYSQENSSDETEYSFPEFTFIELGGGASYLLDKEINEDFNWGYNLNLKMRFDILNHKLSFSHIFNSRIYSTPLDNDPGINNDLRIYKTGIQLRIQLFNSRNNKLNIANFVELGYSWIYNDLTWKENNLNYNPYTDGSDVEEFNLFKGQSISCMVGYRLTYYIGYFEIGYDLLSSRMSLNNELKQSYESENIEYDPRPRYSTNGLNINIGLSIPLYMMNPSGYYNY